MHQRRLLDCGKGDVCIMYFATPGSSSEVSSHRPEDEKQREASRFFQNSLKFQKTAERRLAIKTY